MLLVIHYSLFIVHYSFIIHCTSDNTKNKHDYYSVKDCMKNFSEDLKKHGINYKQLSIINQL